MYLGQEDFFIFFKFNPLQFKTVYCVVLIMLVIIYW